jgi:hypothetical protein
MQSIVWGSHVVVEGVFKDKANLLQKVSLRHVSILIRHLLRGGFANATYPYLGKANIAIFFANIFHA